MSHAPSLFSSLEEIVASIGSAPGLGEIEVISSYVRRERGAYVLSVVIDREGGVDTNLCEQISRYLIRCVDALGPPVPDYRVEVASAGLERPLRGAANFRRFAGSIAKVITTLRIGNRTEFTGAIGDVTDEAVTIADVHAGSTPIPYEAIKRAHLVYEPAQDLKRKR